MGPARSFEDLVVWQKAMLLAVRTYQLAESFPAREQYGLWSQLTRAAASIPANIAEGHGREGRREFANFVSIARGSLAEALTFVELGARLGYVADPDSQEVRALADEVGRMLTALNRSLRASP